MHWLWIWMSTSLPIVLAMNIVLESVQQHAIWTILYRSSLVGCIYGGAVFLIGILMLGYLQPQAKVQVDQAKQQETTKTGSLGTTKKPVAHTSAKTTVRI